MPSDAELRLAVPDALLGAAEAGLRHSGTDRLRLVSEGAPWDAHRKSNYRRTWLELRSSRGASSADADRALEDGSVRAVLRLLHREVDAALVAADATDAWSLLDGGAGSGVDLWLASSAETSDDALAWMDWQPGDWSANVTRLVTAAAWLGSRGARPAYPLWASFAGGRDPMAGARRRGLETLRARTPCVDLELYSPLFYREGRLQAAALVTALRQAWQRSPLAQGRPLVCLPQLSAAEFATRWQQEGGQWSGAFRAGAPTLAARLAADAGPERWNATLRGLLTLSVSGA